MIPSWKTLKQILENLYNKLEEIRQQLEVGGGGGSAGTITRYGVMIDNMSSTEYDINAIGSKTVIALHSPESTGYFIVEIYLYNPDDDTYYTIDRIMYDFDNEILETHGDSRVYVDVPGDYLFYMHLDYVPSKIKITNNSNNTLSGVITVFP